MKKLVSIFSIAIFATACADPPPEHPTPRQFCTNLEENGCIQGQGFESYNECVEFITEEQKIAAEENCKEKYDAVLVCYWDLWDDCERSCPEEVDELGSCYADY